MREPATTRPRLYTIPPSAPFLSTLARAVLNGDLPVRIDDTLIKSEQELADAFTEDKTLPGKVDFAKFVDTRFQGDLA